MAFTNYGLVQLGSYLKGDAPSSPAYIEVGAGSESFIGSQAHLNSGFFRKALTWSWKGNNPYASVSLLTTDCVGSTINEVGTGVSASVGSDLFVRELSAIGDKTDSFSVTLSFESRFSRE